MKKYILIALIQVLVQSYAANIPHTSYGVPEEYKEIANFGNVDIAPVAVSQSYETSQVNVPVIYGLPNKPHEDNEIAKAVEPLPVVPVVSTYAYEAPKDEVVSNPIKTYEVPEVQESASISAVPAEQYAVPQKPHDSGGVPIQPEPIINTYTYTIPIVPPQTEYVVPHAPVTVPAVPVGEYAPPQKPHETYGVPVQPAVVPREPLIINTYTYTIPQAEIPKPVEQYEVQNFQTEYREPHVPFSVPAVPAEENKVPQKPHETYGVPIQPVVIPQEPVTNTYTYIIPKVDVPKPVEQYNVPPQTEYVVPHAPVTVPAVPTGEYAPPQKPHETYGVPVQPAVVAREPLINTYTYTIPQAEIPKPVEQYEVPNFQTEYREPHVPVSVPAVPAEENKVPQKPHETYGVPIQPFVIPQEPVTNTYTYIIPTVDVPKPVEQYNVTPQTEYVVPHAPVTVPAVPAGKYATPQKPHETDEVYEVPVTEHQVYKINVPVVSPNENEVVTPLERFEVPEPHQEYDVPANKPEEPVITSYSYDVPKQDIATPVVSQPDIEYGLPALPHEEYAAAVPKVEVPVVVQIPSQKYDTPVIRPHAVYGVPTEYRISF